MDELPSATPQHHMNAQYRRVMDGLLSNAERDVRLARAAGDAHAHATASARFETLKAALGIYAGSHRAAYGTYPWPQGDQP
ncbi:MULTISPECIES: hypothetical protein [Deinococcus]|uniref:Uncharacterized protein n=1 Tax=Deinococcus rufus TaxID=2136097 RepID=A0ABV7ZE77_9DEIO|nr:hypothetical protein [Deinococcus sp. AB2017081]WQE96689.1 hypothetical protein U2P90_07250 [Deinococcus sp. AB2017081]